MRGIIGIDPEEIPARTERIRRIEFRNLTVYEIKHAFID